MRHAALFPGLMGKHFTSLHPHVKAVHDGAGGRWSGRANVQRGTHLLLRLAALVARLPSSQRDAPTVVTIEPQDGCEVWTRKFGTAAPMRSTLRERGGLLEEQLGLVTMRFRILARDAGMSWELQRIAFLGLPLPLRLFKVQAGAQSSGHAYRFLVAASVVGLGELIRYEGELDVIQ
jgi:Domain of unknown function (DUF4166)